MSGSVIDLFCGIGGLSYGFTKEGFEVLAGVDSDQSCQYAYETNVGAKFVASDIRNLKGQQLAELFPSDSPGPRILVGCAPCQPFSIYTGRYKKQLRDDGQWKLLEDFARVIRTIKPDIVSMENVPRVTRHQIFGRFTSDLETAGYTVSYQVIYAHHYGVPQKRARLVLFASKFGKIDFLEASHKERPRTVRQTIGHLPRLRAGESSASDRLHMCRSLSPINLQRLKATKQGGSWQDWDEELKLDCHQKQGGMSFRSVYGRMKWDAPSPVITTQCLGIGNGRFGHPSQDRAISIREAALLQSFPAGFKFVKPGAPIHGAVLARQIGNAVPVLLSRAIARSIKVHLSQATVSSRRARTRRSMTST